MNDKIVASELKKIAKIIKADYGDVPIYFNVSDFVKEAEGRRLTSHDVEAVIPILSHAISWDCGKEINDLVKKALKKYENELTDLGLILSDKPLVKKQVTVSKKEMDDFVDYFFSFYGKKGLYPIEDLTRDDIVKGVMIRLKKRPDMAWDGDSADREIVRDIVLGWRKQTKTAKNLVAKEPEIGDEIRWKDSFDGETTIDKIGDIMQLRSGNDDIETEKTGDVFEKKKLKWTGSFWQVK